MAKILLLFLIIGVITKPNFLNFSQSNSEKLALTKIVSNTIYSNSMKWVVFELSSPHIITKISWSKINNI